MNGLQQLINQLCPNGVEKKPLWQLTAWDKHFNGVDKSMQKKVIPYKYYLSEEFNAVEKDDGDVLYIATGVSDKKRYTTEELAGDYLAEGEIVCIPWGGTPNVKYHKGKFVTGDNRIATSIDTNILSNKFLYYWMSCNIKDIELLYRGAGIKHPSMKGVLSLQIPLPPLAIQSRIVEILDHFTNLTANLTAELALRRKQFEHFREKLLSFDGVEGVEMKKLGEVCDFIRGPFGGALKKEIFVNDGYAVYEQQHAIYNVFEHRYFVTKAKYDEMKRFHVCTGDIIMSCSGTMGKTAIIPENHLDGLINQALLIIRPNKCLFNKFIKYYFDSDVFASVLSMNKQGGAIQNVASVPILKNISVPLPPLAVQQSIVEQLDKFTALIQNIENELALRQKQCEYYREQLLSFPQSARNS